MNTYQKLLQIEKEKGAGYFVLLDPDKKSKETLIQLAEQCEVQGADALLIGGSLLFTTEFDALVASIKKAVSLPVILFPGNGRQLSVYADAVLFMSLISGRNPHYLIDEQVHSAPTIRALGLEPISTGYMLVESGTTTSAEFMSNTKPLPREKPEIAVAHALAAEYLGMKMLYLEGGSGAERSVPETMIQAVKQSVTIPVTVGGGIRIPEQARAKVEAGASFVVTGTIFEKEDNIHLIRQFADAIHQK